MAHPVFARVWNRVCTPALARTGADRLRQRLLSGLHGTVVEVGSGDGANFPWYPDAVTSVVAVEPEPYLRERAAVRADERIRVRAGEAAQLPVADASVDAVVFCLVLCSVDQQTALAEARRVLRPGGEIRFLEHVRSPRAGTVRRLQRALDATVWPLVSGGCHLTRDTEAAIGSAGFVVAHVDRFAFPEARGAVPLQLILGSATLQPAAAAG